MISRKQTFCQNSSKNIYILLYFNKWLFMKKEIYVFTRYNNISNKLKPKYILFSSFFFLDIIFYMGPKKKK